MERQGHIYALVDPRNDQIRYIGKTLFPKSRLSKHLTEKYLGTHKQKWIRLLKINNIKPSFKILYTGSESNLNFCEIELIKHYKSFCKLTNGTIGGDGGTGRQNNKAIIERMKSDRNPMKESSIARRVANINKLNGVDESNRQRMLSDINPGKKQMKKIYQYTKDNLLIKEWNCIKEAADTLKIARSNISRACNKIKSYNTVGGFIWKFID